MAFGTASGLETRSITPALAPTTGTDQIWWPMPLGGWAPEGQHVAPPYKGKALAPGSTVTPGARPQPQLTPAVGHQPTPKPLHPGQKHACCSMPPAHNHLIYCFTPKIMGLGRARLSPKINTHIACSPCSSTGAALCPRRPARHRDTAGTSPSGMLSCLPLLPGNLGGLKVPGRAARGAASPFHTSPGCRASLRFGKWGGGRVQKWGSEPVLQHLGGEGAAVCRVLRAVVAGASAWWLAGGFCTGCTWVLCKKRAPVSAQPPRGEKTTHPTPVAQPRREQGAEIPPCRLGGG